MNYYVYMMTSKNNKVLYTGITNNLIRRVYEHRNHIIDGFTKKYCVDKLVYFEITADVKAAIKREKQIKGWIREKKNKLVNSFNPQWNDLWNDIIE